jgi:hypothetical protein
MRVFAILLDFVFAAHARVGRDTQTLISLAFSSSTLLPGIDVQCAKTSPFREPDVGGC